MGKHQRIPGWMLGGIQFAGHLSFNYAVKSVLFILVFLYSVILCLAQNNYLVKAKVYDFHFKYVFIFKPLKNVW